MSEILKKSFAVKLISLLFAVFLWFYVFNSDNPTDAVSLTIPIKVINRDSLTSKGLVIKNEDFERTIVAVVRGRKERLEKLRANDFEAILDFSKVNDADTNELSYDGPFYLGEDKNSILIGDVKPRTIYVELEKIVKSSFPVEIATIGSLKNNYKIVKVSAEPQTVSIQDFDSLLKSVASAKVMVDVNNLSSDLTVKKEIKFYNKNGNIIPELGKNLNVQVKVEVAKEIPVVPTIKGKPAKNYIESISILKPNYLLLKGPTDILDKSDKLITAPIDIENATESISAMSVVKIPNGLTLFDSSSEVEVNIIIEQLIEKRFSITKEDIKFLNAEIDNSLSYNILTDVTEISVKSNKSELEKINSSTLNPTIDVAGLSEGTHKLPLKLNLPTTVKLAENYMIEVQISKR